MIILPLALGFALAGCETEESQPKGKHTAAVHKSSSHEETEPSKVRPHRGMTKAQVRRAYGDPDNMHVTSRGETWSYFFNRGHYFIPYYMGKPRTGTFNFNENGILTDFDYNQEE